MSKTVFAFGRMNPPTIGHEKLADKVYSEAKRRGAMPHIFLSHTQNAKKDPLPYNTKIDIAKKSFGKAVTKSSAKTIIQVMQELEKMGHTEVILVAGSDRVPEFKAFLAKYNGKDYNFDKIEVVSAGERDPDAEGVAGMSASKLRGIAKAGDYDTFKQGMPSKLRETDKKKVYDTIRSVMESVEEEWEDISDEELDELFDEIMDDDWQDDIDWSVEGPITCDDDLMSEERKPLTLQQRMKKRLQMRRLAPIIARKRKIALRRMARRTQLVKRSRKAAILLLKKRVAGEKGKQYRTLSPSEKIGIDRLVAKKLPLVSRIAKRLLPKIVKKEQERFRNLNKNEQFDNYINELYFKVDVEGMPTVYMDAPSASTIRSKLRKVIRNPEENIHDIERVERADIVKAFRLRAQNPGAPLEVDEETLIEQLDETSSIMLKKGADTVEIRPVTNKPNYMTVKIKSGPKTDQVKMLKAPEVRDYANSLAKSGWKIAHVGRKQLKKLSDFKKKEVKWEEVAQDPDVKDKEGTQPKKYYSGLKKSTKDARDTHFKKSAKMDDDNPAAYKPAPGDAGAETKPSKYTKKYKQMFAETVTTNQLSDLEKFGDRLLDKFGVDISFSRHFADRMNDDRNKPEIKVSEIQGLFKKIAKKKAVNIKKYPNAEVVLKDIQKDLNLPIAIKVDKDGTLDVVHKTIMRKKNFTTTSPVIKYESYELDEGLNDPGIFKAVFLAGGPGSGKSFIVGRTGLVGLGFKLVNSDPIFELGLKNAGLNTTPEDIYSTKGQTIRDRAKALTKKQQSLYLNGRLGLVIDGTGKDYQKIQKQKEQLEAMGYETAMIFVNTDEDTALKRNRERDRSLPDEEVTKMWKSVQNNLGKFQNSFKSKFFIVDNSEGSNFEAASTSVYKKISAWMKQEPRNKFAQNWISQAKSVRGINEEFVQYMYLEENSLEGLQKKAEKSGISYSILKKVYDRGMAAWRTGHRPGTTPQQWAYARVNSFITGGKTRTTADADLWKNVRKESLNEIKVSNRYEENAKSAINNIEIQVKNGQVWNKDFQDAKKYINQYISSLDRDIMDKHYLDNPNKKQIESEVSDVYYHSPAMHTVKTTTKEYSHFKKIVPASSRDVDYLLKFQKRANTLMTKAIKMIVKGRKPSETPSNVKLRTIENTGTCGICGNNVKMTRAGRLVDHGFNLKYKFRSGNCFGTGYPPIEVSNEAPKKYINVLNNAVKSKDDKIKKLDKNDKNYRKEKINLKSEKKYLTKQIEIYNDIVDNWKIGNLPGELKKVNEGAISDMTKERHKREKESLKTKHDREMDAARLRDARTKNRMTSRNEEFENLFKKDLNESFEMAVSSGIGVTYFAKDLGIKTQAGFALHPSVLVDEEEEDGEV